MEQRKPNAEVLLEALETARAEASLYPAEHTLRPDATVLIASITFFLKGLNKEMAKCERNRANDNDGQIRDSG